MLCVRSFFVRAGKGALCKCQANERSAKCVRAVPSEADIMKNASEMRRALIYAMRRHDNNRAYSVSNLSI